MTFGRGAGAIISAMAAAVRRPLRELPAIAIKFQYLIYPYANFHVGPLGKAGCFKIGPFDLWRDEEAHWLKFLGSLDPRVIWQCMWIGTETHSTRSGLQRSTKELRPRSNAGSI